MSQNKFTNSIQKTKTILLRSLILLTFLILVTYGVSILFFSGNPAQDIQNLPSQFLNRQTTAEWSTDTNGLGQYILRDRTFYLPYTYVQYGLVPSHPQFNSMLEFNTITDPKNTIRISVKNNDQNLSLGQFANNWVQQTESAQVGRQLELKQAQLQNTENLLISYITISPAELHVHRYSKAGNQIIIVDTFLRLETESQLEQQQMRLLTLQQEFAKINKL